MSHFTKCELKMTNLAAIKKALADLELTFNEAFEGQGVNVRGYRGDSLQAAISVDMGKYDIGVIANAEGTYDLTADWWGVETTKGVKGASCLDETKFLEDALGGEVVERQKTSEFYEQSEGYVSTWTGEGRDD